MPGVRGDERDYGGGLGEDHLLPGHVHLAPGAGLLEGRGRAGAVADVGHGDLHGVFVHGYLLAEHLGADDGVLDEVLGHTAADHENAGRLGFHLDTGKFIEIPNGVQSEVPVGAIHLVLDQAEASTRVGERRTENRHVVPIGQFD